MSRELHHAYIVQQGSSNTFRVTDESAWFVLRETWQGARLLDTQIVSKHLTREDALELAHWHCKCQEVPAKARADTDERDPKLQHVYRAAQSDFGWWVQYETRDGDKLLSVVILSSHKTRKEAERAAEAARQAGVTGPALW